MSLIEKWKLRKIKKLRETHGSENALEKFLDDDKWNVSMAAIEAFGFIGTDNATKILIKHFETLKPYHTSYAEMIINTLATIDSQKSIGYIKKIYQEHKYTDHPFYSECASFAKRILNKKGSPEVIIDRITDLNEKSLTNKNIDNKEIKTLCNKVKKFVYSEKHLSQILTNNTIPEITDEIFKKMDDLNMNANPYLGDVVDLFGISKKLLERWTDKELFIQKFNGFTISRTKTNDIQILLSKIDDFELKYKIESTEKTCWYCEGTGKYNEVEKLSELDIYMGIRPKVTTKKCEKCKGEGKNISEKLQIFH